MIKTRSSALSIVYLLGLSSAFVGERLIGGGTLRGVLTGAGIALPVMVTALRTLRFFQSRGDRRWIEGAFLGFAVLGLASLGMYAATLGSTASPKLLGTLGVMWPAAMALAVLPTFLGELAFAGMAQAEQVERGRVRDALLSGVGLASALVFCFAAYYVASEFDAKWDLSYFRTARPGEATRNIVRALEEPVEVSTFFPPSNDVGEQVKEYLDDLARESKGVRVASYDQALDPAKARELGVTGNGTVVIARGKQKELLGIGLELERARGQLKDLDQQFQKRLLAVGKSRRTLYFTTGHGERTPEPANATDQRWTLKSLRELYAAQNLELRNLGVGDGLGSDVPNDAGAVIIAGPTSSFLPEEIASLRRYLERGGRVMLALDSESTPDFADLLGDYGLRFDRTTLANDQVFLARTRQLSDRINIGTASYSSHPAVTSLGRMGQRAPVLMVGAGSLEGTAHRPEEVKLDFTVHSHPKTFADKNGNFEVDAPAETRRVFELAAAVTRGQARLLVFADSDALTDPALENPGNTWLALDGLKWLVGDEALAGEVSSEEDVRIQHTRKQDVAWFYTSVFLAPALVLGVGFMATRRSGQRLRRRGAGAGESKR